MAGICVEKPKAIVYRFYDVIASQKATLEEYCNFAKTNLHYFLNQFWSEESLIRLIEDLRLESYEERHRDYRSPVIFKATQTPIAIQHSVMQYINWKTKDLIVGTTGTPHNVLLKLLWFDGIIDKKLKIPVFEDCIQLLKKCKEMKIEQILYSCCCSDFIDGHRRLLSFSKLGDLSIYISDHISTQLLSPVSQLSYQKIAETAQFRPQDILFLSPSPNECRTAAMAGMKSTFVNRTTHQMSQDLENIPIITSFNDLNFI